MSNVQAKLRGLRHFYRAAVSFSLLLAICVGGKGQAHL